MPTMQTLRAIVQLYPTRYLGASTVLQTLFEFCQRKKYLSNKPFTSVTGNRIKTYKMGNQAPNALPMVFIVEMTKARSSAFPAQISFAHE